MFVEQHSSAVAAKPFCFGGAGAHFMADVVQFVVSRKTRPTPPSCGVRKWSLLCFVPKLLQQSFHLSPGQYNIDDDRRPPENGYFLRGKLRILQRRLRTMNDDSLMATVCFVRYLLTGKSA